MDNKRYHILGRTTQTTKRHYGIIQRYGPSGMGIKLNIVEKCSMARITENNRELFNRILEVILDYYDLEDCNKVSRSAKVVRCNGGRIKDVNDLYNKIEKIE